MNFLRKAREQAGLSIDKAAQILGISGGYLSQIEHKTRSVDEQRALQIANLYKCELNDIFTPNRYASREVSEVKEEQYVSNN